MTKLRFERPMQRVAATAEDGAIWFAVMGIASVLDEKRRRQWLCSALVPLATIGVNYVVKQKVRKPRPSRPRGDIDVDAISRYSFPSAHAASSFASALIITRFEPRLRPLAYGSALLISLGRLYFRVHDTLDVAGGAMLGFLLGAAAWPVVSRSKLASGRAG